MGRLKALDGNGLDVFLNVGSVCQVMDPTLNLVSPFAVSEEQYHRPVPIEHRQCFLSYHVADSQDIWMIVLRQSVPSPSRRFSDDDGSSLLMVVEDVFPYLQPELLGQI